MAKIITIRNNDNSDKHIIGYMMNSLKNDNGIQISNEQLLDILYDIENTKNRLQLFLIRCSDEITLLMGSKVNEIFFLVFEKDIWKEYLVYSHNYDSLRLFGNYNNPYVSYIVKFEDKSIICNDFQPFNEYKKLRNFLYDILKEDNLFHLLNRTDKDLFKDQLIYDYLKGKKIVK